MNKKYKLEIEGYMWGDGDAMHASKGHHDFALFMQAVRKKSNNENINGEVEHIYMRVTPSHVKSEFGSILTVCDPGLGAFPVTRIKES